MLREVTPSTKHSVVVIGSLPPPINGQSKNLAAITEDISKIDGVRLTRCTIAAGSLTRNPASRTLKLFRVAKALCVLFLKRFENRERTLYLVSDGGWGLIYTFLLAWTGRLLGYRLIIQHRTFQYVRTTKRLAGWIDRSVNGFHVFLCDAMAMQYRARYNSKAAYMVVGNLSQYSNFLGQPAPERRPDNSVIRVGLLSNLYLTKGLDTFLAVAQRAKDKCLPVHFVLAGPVPDSASKTLIDMAKENLGSMLEVTGPLHGRHKDAFYVGLDVFMFATRYALEAQPNVVLEAMCAGCAIISADRGCIASDVGDAGAIVASESESNADSYLAHLEKMSANREVLETARTRAHQLAQQGIKRDRFAYAQFLNAVAGSNVRPGGNGAQSQTIYSN
ncbi:glycosyltransferase family 4 protein [uncultured Devosia sp.]|uniref:glycosyltransferase family 4 protein n=1 Tax=uncultured Devosia sp. TaxID=211434 RepID=UPI0026120E08|nr:glycosyltransferase family 4 protein [uncultured Devosia sp.]